MLGDEGRKCRFCSGRHGDQPAADACREEWLAEQRRAPWLDRSRRRAEQEVMEQAEQDTEFGEAQEQQAEDSTCGMPEWIRLAMRSEPTGTLDHLD